jgi:hypothetical protein
MLRGIVDRLSTRCDRTFRRRVPRGDLHARIPLVEVRAIRDLAVGKVRHRRAVSAGLRRCQLLRLVDPPTDLKSRVGVDQLVEVCQQLDVACGRVGDRSGVQLGAALLRRSRPSQQVRTHAPC